jgi:hypothetical protein
MTGLRELGYVEGRNLTGDMRFANGRQDRLPGLVAEVIKLGPDVLVVGATCGARAGRQPRSRDDLARERDRVDVMAAKVCAVAAETRERSSPSASAAIHLAHGRAHGCWRRVQLSSPLM